MGAEAHGTRTVCLEVLGLGSELAVRPCEEQLVGDQAVERHDVGVELRDANPRLERDNLGVPRDGVPWGVGIPVLVYQ